jgi:hypothetical protein
MELKKNQYHVVPRMEYFRELGAWNAILFFPDQEERDHGIGIYCRIEQHSSASRGYFYRTRAPRTVDEWQECLGLIEEERALGPEEDWLEAVITTRIGR